MPRRSRNTNFLPQSSSSSNFVRVNDPRLDQQTVESAGDAESLRRNVRRRLAPTTAENAIDFTDSVNVNGFSGIQTARTMPEECAERLVDTVHQANLGSEGQTVNQPVPSVGGRLDSGANDVTPPFNISQLCEDVIRNLFLFRAQGQTFNQPVPSVGGRLDSEANDVTPPFHISQLSEDVLQRASEMLRSTDVVALQYQINSVLHSPEVDEGNLEDSEDDIVLHGSEVEVEEGNLEDLEHDVVLHGSEVGESDLVDLEDDIVLHGSEVDESDLEDLEDDMHLDVEAMAYEELLPLGEEAILAGVGRHSYQSPNLGSPKEEESCCICQENFVEGEELGKLDCRHEFHFNCIEQWLLQKNACPLCKRAAVAI